MKIFGGNHGRKPSAIHDETAPLPQVEKLEKQAGTPSQEKVKKTEGTPKPASSSEKKGPENASKPQAKGKEAGGVPSRPGKAPGKPLGNGESKIQAEQSGKKKKKRRLKARYIPLIVLGILLVLGVGVYAFLKAFAKPPDVSVKEPEVTLGEGEDDPYADLVEPFIEDGDRERKDDYYTFMFCGTDDGGTRTDTIIVASYNVKTQQVNMVNIPRDTMSNVKRKIKKINGGFSGGPEQLEKELEMLLGIPIDRYVVVSFEGFEELIDLIGGVDFNVPTYMVWDDPSQDLHIYLEPGMQHLDGEKAMELVRFRKGYATQDIQRTQVQQQFLKALAKQCLSVGSLTKIGEFADIFAEYVTTSLTTGNMVWFGKELLACDFDSMQCCTAEGEGAMINGAAYYPLYAGRLLETVNACFNPYDTPIAAGTLNVVTPEQAYAYQKQPDPEPEEPDEPDEPQEAPEEPGDPEDPDEPQEPGASEPTEDPFPDGTVWEEPDTDQKGT